MSGFGAAGGLETQTPLGWLCPTELCLVVSDRRTHKVIRETLIGHEARGRVWLHRAG